LELRDPRTREYMPAVPEGDGVLVLNVGDMLQRFTNDYFISAVHRVSIPSRSEGTSESGLPPRYSIPFFVGPAPFHTVETLPRFVTPENVGKYEPVRFADYGDLIGKKQYKGEEDGNN